MAAATHAWRRKQPIRAQPDQPRTFHMLPGATAAQRSNVYRNKNLTRPLLAMRYVSLLRRDTLMHRTRLTSRAQSAILGPCCELRRLCRCAEQRHDDDMHRATPSVFAFMAAICIAPAFARPRMPRPVSTVYVRQPSLTVSAHLGQYTFGLLHRRTASVATCC
jgi:hypothetical protein